MGAVLLRSVGAGATLRLPIEDVIEIAPYKDRDAADVWSVLQRAHQLDPSLPPTGVQEWRAFVRLSFNHDGRDFLVGWDGGRVVAIATSFLYTQHGDAIRHGRIVVDPSQRRRGHATALLRAIAAQPAPSSAWAQASCDEAWKPGIALLESYGFASTAAHHEMSLERMPDDAPAPDEISIETYRQGADEDTWIALHEAGYRDTPDYAPLTRRDLEVLREQRGFLLLIARRQARAIGMCHAQTSRGSAALVNSVVVDPSARGQGIGGMLLDAALSDLKRKGVTGAHLSVAASNAPARALYASRGFREIACIHTFRCPLSSLRARLSP